MKLVARALTLPPRRVFRIDRSAYGSADNVLLSLEADGGVGWGEAAPRGYYGTSTEEVIRQLSDLSRNGLPPPPSGPQDLPHLWEEWRRLLPSSPSAWCALDLACWDWLAKKKGLSVHELVHGRPPEPVLSSFTLGISDLGELPEKLAEVDGLPVLKLKVDRTGDLDLVRMTAAACPAARLRVDANASWTPSLLERSIPDLARLNVHILEQPLPPDKDEPLAAFRGRCPFEFFADESTPDLDGLGDALARYDGVNFKLTKVGGLTPVLRLAAAARAAGLKTMVGCMLESELLIAAGLVAAAGTDYADLDGAWLLKPGPFRGLSYQDGYIRPAAGPGFGLTTQA